MSFLVQKTEGLAVFRETFFAIVNPDSEISKFLYMMMGNSDTTRMFQNFPVISQINQNVFFAVFVGISFYFLDFVSFLVCLVSFL